MANVVRMVPQKYCLVGPQSRSDDPREKLDEPLLRFVDGVRRQIIEALYEHMRERESMSIIWKAVVEEHRSIFVK